MQSIVQFPIRAEWMYQVRSVCQTFHCKLLGADRFDFEQALIWLRQMTPMPQSIQEGETLKDRLKLCAVDAGTAFHQEYHRHSPGTRCHGSALEASLRAWTRHDDDPRVIFKGWIESFLANFDATHPPPPIELAATILRNGFRSPPDLSELADEVGMSRSVLTRRFRERYKMSCGEYLTRTRLRWFIEQLRASDSPTGDLASESGYTSYHNVADALRRRTALRPGEIRGLTNDQADAVLRDKLELNRV
jgi:AraC-like DNA-binding protein